MMINKRLIGAVPDCRSHIAANVAFQWLSLIANIAMMAAVAHFLGALAAGSLGNAAIGVTVLVTAIAVLIRSCCNLLSARMSYLSSKSVKHTLRELIYQKLLRMGASYKNQVNTAEILQVAVEGVDQLETYFGAYLPQFFYAILATLTLFGVLSFVNFPAAVILLICVPLIPVTIALIQRWAKKLLGKYWRQYTALGDTFLENLQGLTTTKIYQTDELKHKQMNEQSEHFRRITMKVLSMQLNSITIMDLIAYGGAALGILLAVTQMHRGRVDLTGCILIILLSADFFLPMRLLGSFFHIAMNGMAASEKIFALLDLPEPAEKSCSVPEDCSITIQNLHFAYDPHRLILKDISMKFPAGSFTAIVGASGCGKSTLAAILMGKHYGFTGQVSIGGIDLSEIQESSLMEHFTYISHNSYLFKGTVRENLLLARPAGTEAELWQVLEQVNLADFLRSEGGLDTQLTEGGGNLSGGQRQRLALARALLHDSPVYIFDEATSNIDVESENLIMTQIHRLAREKTVILISHRLANVTDADKIYVLEGGLVIQQGNHNQLLAVGGPYATLWNAQQELESYAKGGNLK